MESLVKREIRLMLIPLIGTWWVMGRAINPISPITWWDYSNKGLITLLAMSIYQAACWGLLKLVM